MEAKNIAETVAELTELVVEPTYINETPFLVIPTNSRFESLEHLLPQPKRITRRESFLALESFTRYVGVHKDESSQVHIDRAGNAEAILDGVMEADPSWEAHRARFCLTYSVRWFEWHQRNKKSFTQKEFAEWIEDHARDFFAPKAGDFLDIARTLEVESASNFNSAIKEDNGTFKFGYQRTTTAKSGQKGDLEVESASNFNSAIKEDNGTFKFGYQRTTTAKSGQKGDLEVPSRFTISIPVLESEEPRQIELRLRYDLTEGKLTLSFDILNLQTLLDEVRNSIAVTIANETGMRPYLVANL